MKSYQINPLILLFLATLGMQSCGDDDSPEPGNACIAISEEPIYVSKPVTFQPGCTQTADSYLWYLGDSTTSTEKEVTHTYQSSGSFTVSLVVISGQERDSVSRAIEVVKPSAIVHEQEAIWEDQVWSGFHEIITSVSVVSGTLTIEPGTVIRFHPEASLYVGSQDVSTIVAHGTEDQPIIFTSALDEPVPGSWDHIVLGEYGQDPSFKYCTFEYGGADHAAYDGMVTAVFGASFSAENCTFQYSGREGIYLRDESKFNVFQHNTLQHIDGYALAINPFQVSTIGPDNVFSNKGILLEDVVIDQDLTLTRQSCPYAIQADLEVGSSTGATLTLEPGVSLAFLDGIGLWVGGSSNFQGTLIANGTETDSITFTSIEPQKGYRWKGMTFNQYTGTETSFRYCNIENVGNLSTQDAIIQVFGGTLSIEHCRISGDREFGIDVYSGTLLKYAHNDIGQVTSHSMRIPHSALPVIEPNNTFSAGKQIWLTASILGSIDEPEEVWYSFGVPYYLDYDLTIGKGAKWIIKPGVHIRMKAGKAIYFGSSDFDSGGAALVAVGTPDSTIQFTLAEGAAASTYWSGFRMGAYIGADTRLDHVYISGAENGVRITSTPDGTPAITNSTFENILEYGIWQESSSPTLSNNTFINMGWGDMYVH